MRRVLVMIAAALFSAAAAGCALVHDDDLDQPLFDATGTWSGIETVEATADNVNFPLGKVMPLTFRLAQTGGYVQGTLRRFEVDNTGPLALDDIAVRGEVSKNRLVLLRENGSTVAYAVKLSQDALMDTRMDGTRAYGTYFVKTALTYAVATGPATDVVSDNATLNGGVNTAGFRTDFWFEWGKDPTLATHDNTGVAVVLPGVPPQSIFAELFHLERGTAYFFRAACSNDLVGTVRGKILRFDTP